MEQSEDSGTSSSTLVENLESTLQQSHINNINNEYNHNKGIYKALNIYILIINFFKRNHYYIKILYLLMF